jgi:tetratricopeptide (TPR) repeat protein
MGKRAKRRRSELRVEVAPRSALTWAIPLLLIFVTVLALFPLCGFDFTTWDDTTNVANNPLLNPPTLASLWACWTKPQLAIYVPLTYTVWAVIALVARTDAPDTSGIWLNPYLFHAANLAVHIVAVLMVYALLKRIVGKAWPAAVGALIFAVHPLQVESVGWIAGLKDVLCGMLSIAALWQLVVYAQTTSSRKCLHYALATIAYALALLSKPSAMSLPLLAVLIGRFVCRLPWKQVAIVIGPWFLMAVPIAIIGKLAQPVTTVYDGGKVWLRPLIATDALAFYVYKLLLPLQLAVQYDHYPEAIIGRGLLYRTWIVPAVIVIGLFALRKSLPWLWVAAALIPAALLPVLGLVPFQYERLSVVADHYMYVAMLGPAIIAAYAVTLIPRKAAVIASAVVVTTLIILSNFQTWHWRDTESLFLHEIDVNPRSFAAFNSLGSLEIMRHHPEKAEEYAYQAIRVRSDYAEAWGTLGSAKSALNRPKEAADAFKRAYEFAPGNETAAIAASHYGAAMASIGNRAEGEQYLRRAIELDPNLDESHQNLAVLLANSGRVRDAVAEAEAAVRLGPSSPQNHLTLGVLLDQTGQRERAVEQFRQALVLAPDSALAKRGLAAPLYNSVPTRR